MRSDNRTWVDAAVQRYLLEGRPKAQAEIAYYSKIGGKGERVLIDAVARALTPEGNRHSHQYRIPRSAIKEARRRLLEHTWVDSDLDSFGELHEKVEGLLANVKGIGALYIYDASFRLGIALNLWPTEVYLHAGTRAGARRLFTGRLPDSLNMDAFKPWPSLHALKPYELENVLCSLSKGPKKHKLQC